MISGRRNARTPSWLLLLFLWTAEAFELFPFRLQACPFGFSFLQQACPFRFSFPQQACPFRFGFLTFLFKSHAFGFDGISFNP